MLNVLEYNAFAMKIVNKMSLLYNIDTNSKQLQLSNSIIKYFISLRPVQGATR